MAASRRDLAAVEADLLRRLADSTPEHRRRMKGTCLALEAVQAVRRREGGRWACETTRRRILAAEQSRRLVHQQALAILAVSGFALLMAAATLAGWLREWALMVGSLSAAAGVVGWARWLRL